MRCSGYGRNGGRLRRFCATRIEPHLDEYRDRSNPEQRIQLRVNTLVETEKHLYESDEECHDALALL